LIRSRDSGKDVRGTVRGREEVSSGGDFLALGHRSLSWGSRLTKRRGGDGWLRHKSRGVRQALLPQSLEDERRGKRGAAYGKEEERREEGVVLEVVDNEEDCNEK